MWLHCGTVCVGRVREGTILLIQLLAGLKSLPPQPTRNLGLSAADSWVGGFVYILGPCRSLQWTLLWGWEFFLLSQSPHVFSVRGYEALFHHTGTLGCTVCLGPQLFLLVYVHTNVGLSTPPAAASPCPPTTIFPRVLSALAAPPCPSYWSEWIFLL